MLRSVRQLSFFVTTAESETVSWHQKSVYVSVLSLGLSLSSLRNYYSLSVEIGCLKCTALEDIFRDGLKRCLWRMFLKNFSGDFLLEISHENTSGGFLHRMSIEKVS